MTTITGGSMNRVELDAEMGRQLCQLALCSHVQAVSYEPKSRSGATKSRVLTGDKGNHWAAADYGPPFAPESRHSARTDAERVEVIERTKAEVEHLRGGEHMHVQRPAGETVEQRDARIVSDGQGYTLKEAAIHFRCGERDIRRARVAAGVDPDYGKAPAGVTSINERRTRVVEYRGQGHSVSAIALLLRVSKDTVKRDLRNAA
jgi:hypothetical protein